MPVRGTGGADAKAMARWESFVHGSKMDNVTDVWDRHAAGELAPKVSKKRLEEMSMRVRDAKKCAWWGDV